jgi:hypothetical protein
VKSRLLEDSALQQSYSKLKSIIKI